MAVSVLWLFVAVPWVGLWCVIVVFPDHTYLLFCTKIRFILISLNVVEKHGPCYSSPMFKHVPIDLSTDDRCRHYSKSFRTIMTCHLYNALCLLRNLSQIR